MIQITEQYRTKKKSFVTYIFDMYYFIEPFFLMTTGQVLIFSPCICLLNTFEKQIATGKSLENVTDPKELV